MEEVDPSSLTQEEIAAVLPDLVSGSRYERRGGSSEASLGPILVAEGPHRHRATLERGDEVSSGDATNRPIDYDSAIEGKVHRIPIS
jgi:hypothetical protein